MYTEYYILYSIIYNYFQLVKCYHMASQLLEDFVAGTVQYTFFGEQVYNLCAVSQSGHETNNQTYQFHKLLTCTNRLGGLVCILCP
jgi:hypothetical protein